MRWIILYVKWGFPLFLFVWAMAHAGKEKYGE